MPQRQFIDPQDRHWTVWDVRPARVELELARLRPVRAEHESAASNDISSQPAVPGGWLCFEAVGHKRRLAPIPPSWERLADAALVELCERAADVDRRRFDRASSSGAHSG